MKKLIFASIISVSGLTASAQGYIDFNAYQRGAEAAHQKNMQDMMNAQQYEIMQQRIRNKQIEQMMANATRHNVDAINVIEPGMSLEEVFKAFGAYPFYRENYQSYDVMQWCRTNPPGRPDYYAIVFFQEGKVSKTMKMSHAADMDCRTKPAVIR